MRSAKGYSSCRSPTVYRIVEYQSSRRRFRVIVPNLLSGRLDTDDCWQGTCESPDLVSTRPLRVSGGKANLRTWERRVSAALRPHFTSFITFYVKDASLPQPDRFEDQLEVEALVQVVDSQTFAVGDWYDYANLQVRVVGLRAHVGMEWGKVLISARGKRLRSGCPDVLDEVLDTER